MEISFNTGNIPDPTANQPVARPNVPSPVQGDVASLSAEALKNSIKEIPLVRPEQVARARELVADVKYPPTDVLDRIANLLAIKLKE